MQQRLAPILFTLSLAGFAAADMKPHSDSKLNKKSSHVVSGEVKRVYTTTESVQSALGPYEHTHSVAELVVSSTHKGKGIKQNDLLYVRFLQVKWKGQGAPPPGHSGHSTIASTGDTLKVYLRQGEDNGYDVVMPNGCKIVSKEQTKDSLAAVEQTRDEPDSSPGGREAVARPAHQPAKDLPVSREGVAPVIRGTRVLLAFDDHGLGLEEDAQRTKVFDKALADSKIKIIRQYRRGNRYLLLDLPRRSVRRTLAKLPGHAGAMVFHDGHLVACIPSPVNGAMPQPYATLRWGSNLESVKQMDADESKYNNRKDVRVEMLSFAPLDELEQLGGNPWHLRLTLSPNSTMSLLELFLEAKGEFLTDTYVDIR